MSAPTDRHSIASLNEAATVALAVKKAKSEILNDVRRGVVPLTVHTFSELHDYVDANEYGGLCDDDTTFDIDHANAVQNAVNEWMVAGGITDHALRNGWLVG